MADSNTLPHGLVANDIPDLASIHVAPLDFGVTCWVISAKTAFTLTGTPSMPPDGVTVVAPAPGAAVGKPGAAWEKGSGGGGGSTEFEGTTLAALAGTTGTDANSVAFVFDTEAMYRWLPAGALTPNGWTIVAAPGGQWVVQDSVITLTPTGGGVDDAPRMSAAYNAGAATGIIVELGGGTFTWGSAHQLPSQGLHVRGTPETIINATIPSDPTEHSSPFQYGSVDIPPILTTLNGPATIGAQQFVVHTTVGILVGEFIFVEQPVGGIGDAGGAVYQVEAVDAGTNAVTLDRPILRIFPDTSIVHHVVPLQRFTLEGNGMLITGGGFKAINLFYGWHSHVEGVWVEGSWISTCIDWNSGCFACGFERVRVESAISAAGIQFETAEHCYCRDAIARGSGSVASILIEQCCEMDFDDCHALAGTGHGFLISVHNPNNIAGCRTINLDHCSALGNAAAGLMIADDAQNTRLDECDFSYNLGPGILIQVGFQIAPPPVRVRGGLVRVTGNGNYGVRVIGSGSIENRIEDLRLNGNTSGPMAVDPGSTFEAGPDYAFANNSTQYSVAFQDVTVSSVRLPSSGASPGTQRITRLLVGQFGNLAVPVFNPGDMVLVTGALPGLPTGAGAAGFCMMGAQPLDTLTGLPIDPGVGVAWTTPRNTGGAIELRVFNASAVPTALAAVTWDVWAYVFDN